MMTACLFLIIFCAILIAKLFLEVHEIQEMRKVEEATRDSSFNFMTKNLRELHNANKKNRDWINQVDNRSLSNKRKIHDIANRL